MSTIEEETILEPLSPTGQYLSSSVLTLYIISVLELEAAMDESQLLPIVKDVFLPINPRFSSIMVVDNHGVKRWKKLAEVQPENIVKVPTFPIGKSIEFYDEKFDDYISKLATEQLPEDQPLWEIHIIKYPTSNAVTSIIFKLHHSIGDGFSVMSALMCCLQRSNNPSLPLKFPSVKLHQLDKEPLGSGNQIWSKIHKIFSTGIDMVSDFCSTFARSSFVKDDLTPVRSGNTEVELLPVTMTSISFALDVVKEIKSKLGATINDVISGIIFLGIRLYMQSMYKGSEMANSTSMVLLNTRMTRGYKPVEEMMKRNVEFLWGNNIAFLPVLIPKLNDSNTKNPLRFVSIARTIIQNKRKSMAVLLTNKYLQLVKKLRGPKAASEYMYSTLKNTTISISNVIGPTEQMALANHPIKGLYFVAAGIPQSIMAGIVSYNGKLTVALLVEKEFIDPKKLKNCVEKAFETILKAAINQGFTSTGYCNFKGRAKL